jgi:hypothetical protein
MRRPVRMSGTHISAKLDAKNVKVSNLSLTGALLQLDQALPVDSLALLLLVRHPIETTIQVKVIRSILSTESSGWMVAVTFVNPSAEAKRAIPQLLSPSSRGR